MGKTRFLMGFLLYSPILVLMKLHLFPNWKAKQIIFKHFFGGMSIENFDDYCVNFAAKNLYLLRLSGIGKIQEAKRKKERVLIVSASIDNWVKPFFDFQNLTDVEVLGTQIEVANGKVTRTINNGKGASTLDFDRTRYEIEAFGDSRGDKEMLAFADQGHYKPFRDSL